MSDDEKEEKDSTYTLGFTISPPSRCDVCLVMLLVMDLHDLAADRRLQRAVIIGEVKKREGLD